MRVLLALSVLFLCSTALADSYSVRTRSNSYGGRIEINRKSGTTVYRGSSNQYLGRSQTNRNGTSFYGASGQYRGRISVKR